MSVGCEVDLGGEIGVIEKVRLRGNMFNTRCNFGKRCYVHALEIPGSL